MAQNGGFGACSPGILLKKVIDIALLRLYIGVLGHTPQNVCLLCNLVRLGIYFDYI